MKRLTYIFIGTYVSLAFAYACTPCPDDTSHCPPCQMYGKEVVHYNSMFGAIIFAAIFVALIVAVYFLINTIKNKPE
jgi:hypothetical protein